MKSSIIILAASLALFSSCSVYRSGQTPDDVYYSPAKETAAYVQVADNSNDGYGSNSNNDYYVPSEDRYLRMRVRDPQRWSAFDDYDMYNNLGYAGLGYTGMGYSGFNYNNFNSFYSPYGFSYNNFYSSYWNWNSYYNPYYSNVISVNPKTNPAGYTRLRNFNMSNYRNTNYNTANSARSARPGLRPSSYMQGSNSTNNSGTLGNSVRRVFSGNNNNSRNTYSTPSQSDRPVRTYTPSNNNNSSNSTRSTSSGGGSGSSGGGGGSSNTGSRPSRR